MMEMPPWGENQGKAGEPEGVLDQTKRMLDALDRYQDDLATEDDFIIMRSLMEAVHAAERKGYSKGLLIQLLRTLMYSPPRS
jgi:hypothetical protein